ncbi:probable E3 ubiquitin-protein ligase RHB1A isoform X2 [Hibiscus syriacus]|uniref:probable E3 ubiquitin-protein ligase RHB1A isoform X2 n=1 Tax=Hibiscus syriacus TaxID=106335 RepID=UPI00192231C6|nr:probable E3 ubiquitin-protein ligase RHB1A isoform X2 [Hibiscus syriacus]
MGGCCCCFSSRGVENSAPAYYYNPRGSDRHVPLSSRNATASALSSGLLVDTNLEVSVPDAYQPPPAPVPFDAALGHPQTPSAAQGIHNSKRDETVAVSTQKTSIKSEDAKELEFSKPAEPIVSTKEDDCCPICLEEYEAENPKIITKCEHHFHLACILEWMERSETCPVCDKEMVFDLPTY